jgi:HSP20 family protein
MRPAGNDTTERTNAMNLTLRRKRNPLNGGIARLRDEMERTFDRFLDEPFGFIEAKSLRAEGWIPPLDVSETDSEITVRAETPGIAAKDLDISVTNHSLTIAGTKAEQKEEKGEDYYQCERRFGSFRRVIDLPETADADQVTAESDNGVVTIRIAKKPGAKPKQVQIKPASKKVAVAD